MFDWAEVDLSGFILTQTGETQFERLFGLERIEGWISATNGFDQDQVEKVGPPGSRMMKPAVECLASKSAQKRLAHQLEERLARMKKDRGDRVIGFVERESIAYGGRVLFQYRPESVEHIWTRLAEREYAIEIAVDPQSERWRRLLDKATDVAGEQSALPVTR